MKHDELALFALALPSLLFLLGLYAVPYVMAVSLAVVDNNVARNFVGFQNFVNVWNNGAFQLGLSNTGAFLAYSVPLNIVMPLCIAMLLNTAGKAKGVFIVIFLVPLVIPSGSLAHFWRSIFSINGAINGYFFVDAPINWLHSDNARGIVTFIFMWKNAGYNMLLYLAGLSAIPAEYYEAASLDGAGPLRRFFSITLVYLTPTTFLVLIMSIINSFKAFREIFMLSREYPHTSIYMLQHYLNNQFLLGAYQRLAPAAYIMSAFVLVPVCVIFLAQNRLTRDL